MSTRFVIAAVVSAASLALFAATVASIPTQGALAVDLDRLGPCAFRVTGASESAKSQGLRVGDVVEVERMDPAVRLRLRYPAAAGAATIWQVRRGNRELALTLRFEKDASVSIIGPLIRLVFILLGLIALWRGRDAASLGLGIFFCGLSALMAPSYGLLDANVLYGALVVGALLISGSLVGMVSMSAALTASYVPRWRMHLARVVSPLAAVVFLVAYLFEQLKPVLTGCDAAWSLWVEIGAFSAQIAAAMSILGAALRLGPPAERRRIQWIYWSTIIGFFMPFVGIMLVVLGAPPPPGDWFNLNILVIPFGYAYAVLRHRVIDVGFAINRTLVYGALTTVIVGVLAIAETLIVNAALARGPSLALEIGVALALGLSFNALHKRIDLLVDRVFFRKKHLAEEALLRLAHESAYIEKAPVLLDRTIDDLFVHSGAQSVALYEHEGEVYRCVRERGAPTPPATVDVDDPALVRLRATLRDVDLEEVRSALGTRGLAVPMVVRGRVIGTLVFGPRAGDEPYAPDERALYLTLARDIAAARHALLAKDHADLVGALATGLIDPQAAQARAKDLGTLT